MLPRTPEPEVLMDQPDQAEAYAKANFDQANRLFAELLLKLYPQGVSGLALDLGCGPGDIPLALLQAHPELIIDALDGAQAMLQIARNKQQQSPVGDRLRLHCQLLPCQTPAHGQYDLVISNSLLHHLVDPADLWQSLLECARPGAGILVMDLARPESTTQVNQLVEQYARDESPILREDFRNSLHAAYTLAEVQQQLQGYPALDCQVMMVSDRHWAVLGWVR